MYDGNGNGTIDIEDFLGVLSLFGDVDSDSDGLWDSQDSCVDLQACNYGIQEASECLYPDAVGDCDGSCMSDLDGDGVCDWNACGDPVHYHGYYYTTVQIGEDCWFAENLNTSKYRNGDVIFSGLGSAEWSSADDGAVATYGDSPECSGCVAEWDPWFCTADACDTSYAIDNYARLYNGWAIQDSRLICPTGWRVPTLTDWEVLEGFGAANLKNSSGWSSWSGTEEWCNYYEIDPGVWEEECIPFEVPYPGNGNNSTGFSASPGGERQPEGGAYSGAGTYGMWWASTQSDSTTNWSVRLMNSSGLGIGQSLRSLDSGLSVRCIKDSE